MKIKKFLLGACAVVAVGICGVSLWAGLQSKPEELRDARLSDKAIEDARMIVPQNVLHKGRKAKPAKVNTVTSKYDYWGSSQIWSGDSEYEYGDHSISFVSGNGVYINTGVRWDDEGNGYYDWIPDHPQTIHFNGKIIADKEGVVMPGLFKLGQNGWETLTYWEVDVNPNESSTFSMEYEITGDEPLGVAFFYEFSEDGVQVHISDIELYTEIESIEASNDPADYDLPGIGYESWLGDDFLTLKVDDESTLGLRKVGDDWFMVISVNTQAESLAIPESFSYNGNVCKISRFGNFVSFDWSGAPSLHSLYLPSSMDVLALDNAGSLNDIYINSEIGFSDWTSKTYNNVYLHIPTNYYRWNYTDYGFARVLMGEETPEYPEVSISQYFIKNDAGDYFGIADYDGVLQVVEIVSENESVILPQYAPWGNRTLYISGFGLDSWYGSGYLFDRAQSVNSVTVPTLYNRFNINCDNYNNFEEAHLLCDVPALNGYTNIKTAVLSYVLPQYYDNYINDGWNVEVDGEDTTEWITVNVAKEGEFGDVYLTENDYDLGKAVYLKVTGNIGQTDLEQMKSLTSLSKLDLSETTVTSIPYNFMSNKTTLKEVVLPTTMRNIGERAFYGCSNLKFIDLGGTTTIRPNAFYNCSKLSYVDLSDVETIDYNAFSGCSKLDNLDFSNVKTINYSAFYDCASLKSLVSNNIEFIGDHAFSYCGALETVDVPNATSISSEAFIQCTSLNYANVSGVDMIANGLFNGCQNLTEVILSDNLYKIYYGGFRNCSSLTSIELPDNLESIEDNVFYGCSKLTDVVLPATLKTIGSGAFSKTGITTLRCKAAVPPTANGEFLSGIDVTRAVLYVPAFSRDFYRNTQYWSAFYMMRPLDEPLDYIYVDRPLTINLEEEDNDAVANSPKIELSYYYDGNSWYGNNTTGQLEAKGEGTLSAGHMQINALVSPSPTGTNYIPTLINHADKMRADSVSVAMQFNQINKWYALSLPFDVKVKDIEAWEDTYWAIKYYDGASRAQGEPAWKDLGADDTMLAGKGYIISVSTPTGSTSYYDSTLGQYINYYPGLTFHSGNSTTKNNIFRPNDVIVPLEENIAEFAHNRSWNLVGNPYPAYFDMHCLNEEFTSPITVWNGSTYSAFSPVDDNLTLMPYEAFFVQRPLDQESITFKEEGRKAAYNTSSDKVAGTGACVAITDRNVFNFNFATENGEDRTRIVLNENASAAYEIERDASKFFGNDGVEAYVVSEGVTYAIDERPLGDGTATLAYRASGKNIVTLSLNGRYSDEWDVILTDAETGVSVNLAKENYEFVTEAGDFANRFKVEFSRNSGTGIDEVIAGIGADADVTVISLDGTILYNGSLGDYKAEEGKVVIVKTADKAIKTIF